MRRTGFTREILSVVVLVGAMGCGGEDSERDFTTMYGALEPAIPSCPSCELKKQLLPNKATAKGTFSSVDTSVFKEARIVIDGTTQIPVPLPTGGPYSQLITVPSPMGSAVMEFRYKTGFGDLRWATNKIALPITSIFSGPF